MHWVFWWLSLSAGSSRWRTSFLANLLNDLHLDEYRPSQSPLSVIIEDMDDPFSFLATIAIDDQPAPAIVKRRVKADSHEIQELILLVASLRSKLEAAFETISTGLPAFDHLSDLQPLIEEIVDKSEGLGLPQATKFGEISRTIEGLISIQIPRPVLFKVLEGIIMKLDECESQIFCSKLCACCFN